MTLRLHQLHHVTLTLAMVASTIVSGFESTTLGADAVSEGSSPASSPESSSHGSRTSESLSRSVPDGPFPVSIESLDWRPDRPRFVRIDPVSHALIASAVPPPSASTPKGAPLSFPTIHFRWPLRNQDWWHIANYVDLDPAASAVLDWGCQAVTYDGHTGNDVNLQDFTQMDEGRWIVAGADGVVSYVVDGYFDRNTFPTGRSNYVLVEHTDGTRSWYYHLRKWSSLVDSGQTVFAGQPLGQVGSSGPSSWPHVHFEVDDGTTIYEPFAGACRSGASLWDPSQPAHVTTRAPALFDAGVLLAPPTYEEIVERPAPMTHVRQSGATPIYYWTKFTDLHAGDAWTFTVKAPGGSVFTTFGDTFTAYEPLAWYWFTTTLPSSGSTGTWTIDLRLNGVLQPTTTFVYNASAYANPVVTGRTVGVPRGVAAGDLRGSDADGGLNAFQLVTPPAHGEVVLSGPRSARFRYVPVSGYAGSDTFQFRTRDAGGALSAAATMTLTVTGTLENALRLEDEGDHVSVPYTSALDLAGPFTIESWIKREPGAAEFQTIVDRRHTSGATDDHGWSLILLTDNHLYFSIGGGTFAWYAYGETPIPLGRWTHVAATWDGTVIRLYVDGLPDSAPSFFSGPVSYAGVGEMRIGTDFYAPAEDGFRGEIQEMRIWSVARTGAEIAAGKGCAFFNAPPPGSLRARWRFLGNALDATPFHLDGALVNGASFVRSDSGVPLNCAGQDLDGDGRADAIDNCPLSANVSQTDADADGVGDPCDLCPSVKDPRQVDADRDAVGDLCDDCPFVGNTEQTDADTDGAGDLCDPSPASSTDAVPSAAITLTVTHSAATHVSSLSWTAEPRAASYEVFRATREMLRAGFYGVCQNTRDPVTTDRAFAESQSPPPGGVHFYLVLGVSSSGARGLAGLDPNGRQIDLRAGDCL